MKPRFDILEAMQQDGYLSSRELIALRKTCQDLGENQVQILRSLNIASPELIQDYLQKYFHILVLEEKALAELNPTFQNFVPVDLAIFYSCFGIGEENGTLYLALEDPSDRGTLAQLKFFLNKRIIGVAATVYQLASGLQKIYQLPLSSLKLTTVIERSRGVVGGVRYEEVHETYSGSLKDRLKHLNFEIIEHEAEIKNLNSEEEFESDIDLTEEDRAEKTK